MKISFLLNGKKTEVEAEPEARLIDLLRSGFRLTGIKEVCGEGKCGSCSVLFNGKLELACLIPAIRADNSEVVTIEGLGDGKIPNYVQKAFVEAGAIQCGFCTPGLVMSVFDYLEKGGTDDREKIKSAIAGNLCRCTGYSKVIDAVALAFKYKNENN